MNEKQFEKYLEKTKDKVYRETEKFFKKYPDDFGQGSKKMKNPILQICEKLRGYSSDTEYFEVVSVRTLENGNFEIEVREVNENEEAEDEVLV